MQHRKYQGWIYAPECVFVKEYCQFKAAIFLMVLKDEANGFSKMLNLCAIPSEEKWNCFLRHSSKSKESHQWRKDIELQSTWKENLINESKSLVLEKLLNAVVLGYTEKELDWHQQWPIHSWEKRMSLIMDPHKHTDKKQSLMYFSSGSNKNYSWKHTFPW